MTELDDTSVSFRDLTPILPLGLTPRTPTAFFAKHDRIEEADDDSPSLYNHTIPPNLQRVASPRHFPFLQHVPSGLVQSSPQTNTAHPDRCVPEKMDEANGDDSDSGGSTATTTTCTHELPFRGVTGGIVGEAPAQGGAEAEAPSLPMTSATASRSSLVCGGAAGERDRGVAEVLKARRLLGDGDKVSWFISSQFNTQTSAASVDVQGLSAKVDDVTGKPPGHQQMVRVDVVDMASAVQTFNGKLYNQALSASQDQTGHLMLEFMNVKPEQLQCVDEATRHVMHRIEQAAGHALPAPLTYSRQWKGQCSYDHQFDLRFPSHTKQGAVNALQAACKANCALHDLDFQPCEKNPLFTLSSSSFNIQVYRKRLRVTENFDLSQPHVATQHHEATAALADVLKSSNVNGARAKRSRGH